MTGSDAQSTADGEFAPFRPRRARTISYVLAVVVVVAIALLFFFVRPNAGTRITSADYMIVILFGALLLGVLWRQESVSAVPDDDGLVVRNLLTTRRVYWAEIVSVRFSPDRPWARLDLTDGDELLDDGDPVRRRRLRAGRGPAAGHPGGTLWQRRRARGPVTPA